VPSTEAAEGVIRISGRAPDALGFELPFASFRSGDRAIGSRHEAQP
jgi:hypothetical protein